MTENQRQNLIRIAMAIRQGYNQVSESFVIGQIMLVTGRSYDKAIEGLRIMQSEKLLPPEFIDRKTEGCLERLIGNYPAMKKIFDRLDAVPARTEIVEFQGFVRPKTVDRLTLEKRFSLPEF